MADLAVSRRFIQVEESRYKAAVSEAVAQKMGEMMNFLGKRQFDHITFYINGQYSIVPAQLGVDGLFIWPWDSEITNVSIFNLVAGSGGTTELDLKRATTSGGAFSSIFTTRPAITSAAGANAYGLSYTISDGTMGQTWALNTPPAGVTLGVLSSTPFNINAGHALRFDEISKQTAGENAGVIIYHRPR